MLYSKESLPGPTTLYYNLRDYLAPIDFHFEKTPDSNRLLKRFAHCFFTEKEGKQYAIFCQNNLCQPNFNNNTASTNTNAQPINATEQRPNYFDGKEAAPNISQQFKNEKFFIGKMDEIINKFPSSCKETCADYGLNEKLELLYHRDLLDEIALWFYRSYVQNFRSKLQLVAGIMSEECSI